MAKCKTKGIKFKNIKIIGLLLLFLIVIFFLLFKNVDKEIIMIDLINYTEDEVVKFASKHGIDLEIDYKYSDSIDSNKVIKQSISKGELVTKDTKLIVTISLGITPTTLYKEYKVNELGSV
ncbi:MAG: PASTA domain-containing protein, partial [Bacilli bacterium]|nr:PASTA domain-containing protein [Bacilli bacterium]